MAAITATIVVTLHDRDPRRGDEERAVSTLLIGTSAALCGRIGLALLRVVDVRHGDPAVPDLLLAEPSDPREIHVIQRDEVAVLRRVREGVLPLGARRLLIDVEL